MTPAATLLHDRGAEDKAGQQVGSVVEVQDAGAEAAYREAPAKVPTVVLPRNFLLERSFMKSSVDPNAHRSAFVILMSYCKGQKEIRGTATDSAAIAASVCSFQ